MQSVVKLWSPEQNKTGDNEEPHRAIQQLKVKGPPGTAIEGKEVCFSTANDLFFLF